MIPIVGGIDSFFADKSANHFAVQCDSCGHIEHLLVPNDLSFNDPLLKDKLCNIVAKQLPKWYIVRKKSGFQFFCEHCDPVLLNEIED